MRKPQSWELKWLGPMETELQEEFHFLVLFSRVSFSRDLLRVLVYTNTSLNTRALTDLQKVDIKIMTVVENIGF